MWPWILTVVIGACIYPVRSQYVNCNRTFDGSQYGIGKTITISMTNISEMDVGKSIQCWLHFIGTRQQRVLISVKSVRVGTYNGEVGCEFGQLKISDGSGDWTKTNFHPTVLCGYYKRNGAKKIHVRRFSSQNSAKVDFWVTQASSETGYDIEAKFLDYESGGGLRGNFGNYHANNGKVPGSKCDWVIPVDKYCKRKCSVVSPGYPGIYPPNTRCRYHLVNNNGERVQLWLSPRHSGKFDMKSSKGCRDDYVKLYDGNSTSAPLVGTFCAHDGGDFISSKEALLVEFQSGSGGPPWDYSGFEGHVEPLYNSAPTGGIAVASSGCDYTIYEDNSTALDGDMNTPDYIMKPGTACVYKFISYPNHHVELEFSTNYFSENCNEVVEVMENDMVMKKMCSDHIEQGTRNEFSYISSGPNVTVRYFHRLGQMSNQYPVYINYIFRPGNSPAVYKNLQPTATTGTSQIIASTTLIMALLLSYHTISS